MICGGGGDQREVSRKDRMVMRGCMAEIEEIFLAYFHQRETLMGEGGLSKQDKGVLLCDMLCKIPHVPVKKALCEGFRYLSQKKGTSLFPYNINKAKPLAFPRDSSK